MAISSYSDFYTTLRVRASSCPDMLLLQAIQFAVRQFCIDSESYIWESDPYDLTDSEFVYTIDQTPTGIYDIVRIKDVQIKTDTGTTTMHDKGPVVWDRGYNLQRPNILEFTSPPVSDDYSDSMYVRLVLAPFEDYTTMDYDYINRWMEPIRAKALAYLYSIPGRLWSDPVQSANFEAIYRKWVASARRENETEGTDRQLSMARGGSFL